MCCEVYARNATGVEGRRLCDWTESVIFSILDQPDFLSCQLVCSDTTHWEKCRFWKKTSEKGHFLSDRCGQIFGDARPSQCEAALFEAASQLLPVDTGVLSLSLATQPLRMDPPAGHLIGWWDKAKIKKNGILQPSKSWKNLSSFSTQPPPHLLCISRLPAQTKYCCHSDRWSGNYWLKQYL